MCGGQWDGLAELSAVIHLRGIKPAAKMMLYPLSKRPLLSIVVNLESVPLLKAVIDQAELDGTRSVCFRLSE